MAKVAPNAYWKYSLALFNAQKDFYDIPASESTPTQIREKLAELGKTAGVLSDEEVDGVKELLKLSSTPNGGTSVTGDLKLCSECAYGILAFRG